MVKPDILLHLFVKLEIPDRIFLRSLIQERIINLSSLSIALAFTLKESLDLFLHETKRVADGKHYLQVPVRERKVNTLDVFAEVDVLEKLLLL